MRRKNIIAAMVIIVITIIYGLMTLQLPTRSLPDTPGPTFFPWINVVIILFLSVVLLLSSVFSTKNFNLEFKQEETQSNHNLRALLALIGFAVYLVTLPSFGFLFTTIPFFSFLMVMFSEKRPLYILSSSVGLTFLFYFVFRYGFNIFLPAGALHDAVLKVIL